VVLFRWVQLCYSPAPNPGAPLPLFVGQYVFERLDRAKTLPNQYLFANRQVSVDSRFCQKPPVCNRGYGYQTLAVKSGRATFIPGLLKHLSDRLQAVWQASSLLRCNARDLAGMQLREWVNRARESSPRTSVSSTSTVVEMANSQAERGWLSLVLPCAATFNLLANDPINYTSLTSVQLGRTDDCDRAGCPEDRIHQMTEENPTGDHADVAT